MAINTRNKVVAILSMFGLFVAPPFAFAGAQEFNQRGDLLIADQFNNRVIEIQPDGEIVWQFGLGPNDISPNSIVGTNDAQRVGSLTLMAGTGVPAASPPLEPKCAAGCADNRVLFVDKDGHIEWQYGQFGVTGSGPNQLIRPLKLLRQLQMRLHRWFATRLSRASGAGARRAWQD